MTKGKKFCFTSPIDLGTNLIAMLLGPWGCTILFFLATIFFFFLDIQSNLYFSKRFIIVLAFLLIIFFGFLGPKDTLKQKVFRYSMIGLGALFLIAAICTSAYASTVYGGQNLVPCLIADHKLEEDPGKAFLIEKDGGKDIYLARSTLSPVEVEAMVKQTIGPSVNVQYRQSVHTYTLKRNEQIIGTVEFAPDRKYLNLICIRP